jgi:hypothetical protein
VFARQSGNQGVLLAKRDAMRMAAVLAADAAWQPLVETMRLTFPERLAPANQPGVFIERRPPAACADAS